MRMLTMLRILWGIQICMQNRGGNSTPDLPPAAPPPKKIWLLGLDPQGVNFFQKPHICVLGMISVTRGSF